MKRLPGFSTFLRSAYEHLPGLAPAIFLFVLPFSGTVALRLSLLAISTICALQLTRTNPHPPVPLKIPFFLWLGVALLSLVGASDFTYSVGEIKNEIGYTAIAFSSFFVLAGKEHHWKVWITSLMAGFVAAAVLASYYFYGSLVIHDGQYIGSGSLSTYLILIAPIVFMLFERSCLVGRHRVVSMTLLVLIIACGFMSLSRAFWPALVVSATLYVGLRLIRHRRISPLLIVCILAIGSVVVVFGLMLASGTRYATEITFEAALRVINDDPRLEMWRESIRQILHHPIAGAGFGVASSRPFFALHFDGEPLWHAHNAILNCGLQMGFPGLMAGAYLFFSIAREFTRMWRSPDERCSCLGAAGLAILSGAFAKSMTDSLIGRGMSLLLWALMGVLLGLGQRLLSGTLDISPLTQRAPDDLSRTQSGNGHGTLAAY